MCGISDNGNQPIQSESGRYTQMNFVDYLISKGFKPHRKEFINKEYQYIPDLKFHHNYSSISGGLIDVRLLKEGYPEFIFGLNERHKPPTLCYPRPKGVYSDDAMNRMLLELSNEEIFNLCAESVEG